MYLLGLLKSKTLTTLNAGCGSTIAGGSVLLLLEDSLTVPLQNYAATHLLAVHKTWKLTCEY